MKERSNFREFCLVILICLLLCFPTSAWAAVYYVDIDNGSNLNDGTSSGTGAWKTFHYAIDQINAGSGVDLLNVAAGIYSEANGDDNAELSITQSDVTIQGAPGATSIIDGSVASESFWNPGINITGSNVTIRGLAVRNFSDDGTGYGIHISSGAGNIIIEGCEVYDNDKGIVDDGASPTIRKNKIYNNGTGISLYSDLDPTSPIIRNNLVYGSTMGDGIYISAGSGAASPTIYHNTIDGGTSRGIAVEFVNSGTPIIKYNIITNFGQYGISRNPFSVNPTIAYNTVSSNTMDYTNCAAGPGDISQGPNYRNRAGQNYELNDGSPCIDAIPLGAGDPVTDDFDGNPRPQGSGYDMGAYEDAVSSTETVPIPPGIEIEDYVMISFTVEPDDPACTAVFGPEMGGSYDRDDFRFGRYKATLNGGSYEECGSNLQIVPGRAFWAIARNGVELTVDGPPASLGDTEVPLLYNSNGNGWNQIGSPNAEYAWDDVQVLENGAVIGAISDLPSDNDWIDKRLWCWENGSYYPDNIFMEQGEGYWVRAKKANVSLKFLQSTQMAQLSNSSIMFAGLFNKAKRWMKEWVFSPKTAIASSDDSPPMPMGVLGASESPSADTASEGDGGGGCFVDSLQ